MKDRPEASDTGCLTAYLPTAATQWITAFALVIVSWGLFAAFILGDLPGHREQSFPRAIAAFVLGIVTVGYIIFLRAQSVPLEITPTEVRLLGRSVLRGEVEILRWRHFLHSGAVLVISGAGGRIRLGVSHHLPAPLHLLRRADAHVDAILSPPDFSDAADLLGAAHLGWEPASGWWTAPMTPWVLTIASECALGAFVVLSHLDRTLLRSQAGRLFLQTIAIGIVAVGMTLTMARGPIERTRVPLEVRSHSSTPRLAHADRGRPSFWRAAAAVLGLVGYSFAGFAVFGTPLVLVSKAFERWVDVPGCQATCARYGLPYRSFGASKSGNFCICDTMTIRHHTNVLGGDGILAGLVEWLVRSTAYIVGLAAWLGLLIGLVVLFVRLRGRR
jgi:hypothetical protein